MFYILSLSFLPCCENDGDAVQNIFYAQASDHSGEHHEEEGCSPFCQCACCGMQAFQYLYQRVSLFEKNYPTESIRLFSHYQFSYAQEIFLTIWQPPKISNSFFC